MAEALWLAASVIAVIDLSAKVASRCSEYNVKNAPDDIERLQRDAVIAGVGSFCKRRLISDWTYLLEDRYRMKLGDFSNVQIPIKVLVMAI